LSKLPKSDSPFKTSKTALKLALVGAETMLGVELREVLERRLPSAEVALYAATGEGSFDEKDGEAVYRDPLSAETARGSSAILTAGTPEGALKAYGLAKTAKGKLKIIDCSGHLENRPEARIVSPLLEVNAEGWLSIPAHPAASAIALILTKLAGHRAIARSVVEIFAPASEYGKRGIAELHQQTTSLLAFKPLDQEVFDTQLSFNMLAQYGEEAPVKLSALEQRVERHIVSLFGKQGAAPPLPSLRLLQAPVFHGYSLSLWVEFDSNIAAAELGEALGSKRIDVRAFGEESPHNVGAANQSGLIAGDIRVDHNNPRAAWLWVVFDNLRVTADETADLLIEPATQQTAQGAAEGA
jgi:aspartate-semialdehyde dehydrogenase